MEGSLQVLEGNSEPHVSMRDAIEGVKKVITYLEIDADNPAVIHDLTVEQRAAILSLAFKGLGVSQETSFRVSRWLDNYQGHFNGRAMVEWEAAAVLNKVFNNGHDEMVMVKDIAFTALCAHHLLPFQGKAAVGYIPEKRVVGLSKLARLVTFFTQWPTLQEDMTKGIANTLDQALTPKGVMVVVYDVMHSCMSMRGVQDPDATTTTSAVRGVFKEKSEVRAEFLALLK